MSGGCNRRLAEGQWWSFCGETDMGQTIPVLCVECGGGLQLHESEYEKLEQPEPLATTASIIFFEEEKLHKFLQENPELGVRVQLMGRQEDGSYQPFLLKCVGEIKFDGEMHPIYTLSTEE